MLFAKDVCLSLHVDSHTERQPSHSFGSGAADVWRPDHKGCHHIADDDPDRRGFLGPCSLVSCVACGL